MQWNPSEIFHKKVNRLHNNACKHRQEMRNGRSGPWEILESADI